MLWELLELEIPLELENAGAGATKKLESERAGATKKAGKEKPMAATSPQAHREKEKKKTTQKKTKRKKEHVGGSPQSVG